MLLTCALCPASELHWRNGEWFGGDFMGMEDGHVIWRTPMFAGPVKVSLGVLKRVNRFKLDEKTEEPFSVRLVDGSRLYGTITSLTADTLEMKSARFGTLSIHRDAVLGVQRLKAEGMLFAQPTSTTGWVESKPVVTSNTGPKSSSWRVIPGAALQQVGWNRTTSLPLEAPEMVEMQFTLNSSVRPEFKVELKADDDERMIVETWVDDLVLQGRVFQSIKRLNDNERRIALTLFWNRNTGLCAVYGEDGKKIVETRHSPVDEKEDVEAKADEKKAEEKEKEKKPAIKGGGLFGALFGLVKEAGEARVEAAEAAQAQARRAAAEPETPVGFTLLNKGPDITLETLRIRAWDGKLPSDITDVRPRVELTDGHYLKAAPVSATSTALTVRDDKGRESSLPWDKVLAVELSAAKASTPPTPAASPAVELWFTDGEWLQGTLQQVKKDTATLKTAFSDAPVNFKITRMHHLQFKGDAKDPPEDDLTGLDSLTIDKKVLHGTLDASGGTQPRWKLLGALEPATLAGKGDLEISRAASASAKGIGGEALFYLGNGDVLPGRLRAIDARRVDLESDVATVKQLPPTKLQAIQFGGRALNLDGFEDAGWLRLRGAADTVKRDGKAGLEFSPGGSWGHPAFMQVNEISFNLLSNGFNALRVRLFCEGVNAAAPSTNLLFGHMGSEVCFGLEASGDQMDKQFRLRSSGTVPVRIEVGENSIEIFINSVSARKVALTPKMRSGSGIIIEPFSLWGNGEREVKINSFSARVAPGRIAAPTVEQRSKEHALTVPRFRKEDPPRHALVAANGDILRGVIEAATAEHFAVRSGLETIQVPRERVKAAVWLITPADDVSAAFEAQANAKDTAPPGTPPDPFFAGQAAATHWLLLNNGGRLGLKVDRFADDAVIGTSELLGDCRVPLGEIHAIRSTRPSDNTAMVALRGWKLKFAPEPVLPETGGESSPLLNQDAKPFKLPLLAGGDFDLAKEKGKVIVLDFWATWCGPCIKGLPEMTDAMAGFDPKKVRFIAVNQAESKEQVKPFLETRGWKFEVAFDANQRVGQTFGVEGIPHTVIVGPDGKIAYVATGYSPDHAKKAAEMVHKLLGDKTAEPAP
ncbi:TlpA family protein disulfide reductase [Prosthecobacter sp.]